MILSREITFFKKIAGAFARSWNFIFSKFYTKMHLSERISDVFTEVTNPFYGARKSRFSKKIANSVMVRHGTLVQ